MSGHRKQLKRFEHRNELRFLTFSCYQRLGLFNNDAIKDHFVNHFIDCQATLQFKTYAWVLMPEHIHLLIRPQDETQTVETILRRLKSSFGQGVIRRWEELHAPILKRITIANGTRRFWQRGGGYDRNTFSEKELIEKIGYIHLNPVKRGLVSTLDEWKWSSARWYEKREDYVGPPISNAL